MSNDSIFSRIETALEGEEETLKAQLSPLEDALETLMKSGDPKAKAGARRAKLAVGRAKDLFDELFELREKMRDGAATD
jgi:hypothetical protein